MDLDDWSLFHSKTKAKRCEDTKGIVAYAGERILAAAAFDSWTSTGCQMHIWIEDPFVIRHGFINEICNYVFNTCGRRILCGLIPSSNRVSLRFAEHAGMAEVYRVVDGFAEGVDYVLVRMDKHTCRWINGQKGHAGPPGLRRRG